MIYSVTYDVICGVCKEIAWHGEIGEYPWSWQFSVCPHCGGAAVPDLEHPTEHRLTQRASEFHFPQSTGGGVEQDGKTA